MFPALFAHLSLPSLPSTFSSRSRHTSYTLPSVTACVRCIGFITNIHSSPRRDSRNEFQVRILERAVTEFILNVYVSQYVKHSLGSPARLLSLGFVQDIHIPSSPRPFLLGYEKAKIKVAIACPYSVLAAILEVIYYG